MTTQEKTRLIERYKGKSLEDLCPDLAKEWHPTKNGDLTPKMVGTGSEKRIWWLLSYDDENSGKHFDFEWQAPVYSRARGCGCPFLSHHAVWTGYNDLLTLNPRVASEWHPIKNEEDTPQTVSPSSNKKVWWICDKGHEWRTTVNSRANGHNCPVCKEPKGEAFISHMTIHEMAVFARKYKGKSLKDSYPDLAKEWHPTKNGDLTPEMVCPGSNRKVWWYLPYKDPKTGKTFNFEWFAAIKSRSIRGNKCPFFSGRAVWKGFNDLASVNPQIALQWHPTLNQSLTPEMVTANSKKVVWWRCEKGHEWQTCVHFRTIGHCCPHCGMSRGERRVVDVFDKYNVITKMQHTFDDCVYQNKLRFDCAVLDETGSVALLVEYDGEQHFKPVNFTGHGNAKEILKKTQTCDRIKNEYCREKRIPLVRISYKDYDNIERILLRKMVRYGLI